jgi:hypothetical protein
MRLRSFTKPYEMLPPVPGKERLTHGSAYQHGAFLKEAIRSASSGRY